MEFSPTMPLSHKEPTPTQVLVAEDDPVTRLLLCSFLRKKGHDVLVATDGEQAWSLYVSHRPKLVISDWRMPKLDGLGLCRRIRELSNDEYTIVLILTSTTDKEAMIQGFASGADDHRVRCSHRPHRIRSNWNGESIPACESWNSSRRFPAASWTS